MRGYTIERFGPDLGGITLGDAPAIEPGTHEIVVRIRANSLNYRDLIVAMGRYPGALQPGLVPLSDGAGEVVAIGDKVSRVKVGDRVAPIFNQYWLGGPVSTARPGGDVGGNFPGVLAEQVVLSEDGVVKIPSHMSFEEAATLPCAAVTAWSALTCNGGLQPGDTLLVQGSGGVSVFALQLGKIFGAKVIATTSSPEKTSRLKELGADEVIDYKATPEWGAAARALTNGGRGVDRIVEVGGPGTFTQSIGAAARGGTIAAVGFVGGPEGEINPRVLIQGQLAIQGITVGSRAGFEALVAACEASKLKPVIDKVFPFEAAPDAYKHLAGKHHFGKVVIAGA